MRLGMFICFPSQRSQEYCVSLFVVEGVTRIVKLVYNHLLLFGETVDLIRRYVIEVELV